jgi:hypothetical protein
MACVELPPLPDSGAAGRGGEGGTGGIGGSGGTGDLTFPCTEQGIRNAIALGGGPHTFSCEAPTPVTTLAEILIEDDVILDGGGNLIVDGDDDHRIFEVTGGTVELREMTIVGGNSSDGGGVRVVRGDLTMKSCSIAGNTALNGGGIVVGADAALTLTDSTVSGNEATRGFGGGILVIGELAITNSTVSENLPNAIYCANAGSATLAHVTVRADPELAVPTLFLEESAVVTMSESILSGRCNNDGIISGGHNIESPSDTCGLSGEGDADGVGASLLDLGPLQQNGGLTQTHEPRAGSVAIDAIDVADCELEADQRGVARPQGVGCDVGAVEVVP